MSIPYPDSVLKDTISGIALTTLLSSIAISIPIIGFVCLLLLPQSAIFYRLRLGRKPGLAVIGAPILLILLFSGEFFADAAFLFGMLGLGFSMGECLERRLPLEKTVGYACGAVVMAGFFALMIYANMMNVGIITWVSDYISKNLQMTVVLYEKMGMPEESIRMIEASMAQITYVLVRILPSLIVAGLLFAGWLNLLAARGLFGRFQMAYADFGSLNRWKAPDFLVWVVIAGIAMVLIPSTALKVLGVNCLVVLMTVYFFQGIAVMAFYFEKKGIPRFLRGLIYAFIAIQQFLLLVVVGLGFFDVWANFRRIDDAPTNGPESGPTAGDPPDKR